MRNSLFKRILTFVLAAALVAPLIQGRPFDLTVSAATESAFDRVADHESVDYWKGYFSDGQYDSNVWSDTISTQNAGAIWTDKSVFLPNDSITIDGVDVPVADTGDNFLVSMSVMASNKTVKGYEYIPTSTMLVLDVSASMGDGQNGNNSWDEMVEAANKAIDTLLNLNNNNLVGVVLYSGNNQEGNSNLGHSTLLLPLNRYTTTAINNNGTRYNTNDDYPEYLTASNSKVSVNSAVRPITNGSKNVSGGTYIQGGLYRAMEELVAYDAPKTVTEGVQAGMAYTPIVVLMSDGAPTAANLDYDFSETNDNNHDTEIGNGTSTNERIGFLTQLTAAYTKARVDAAYEKDMLFYTLGLGLDELSDAQETIAEAVLNPGTSSGDISTYWNRYLALDNDPSTQAGNTMYLNTYNNGTGYNAVVKNEYVTSEYKNYVTQYFEAVATTGTTLEQALLNAFQQIVDAIVIQSLYYPTEIAGGSADLGGYVTFRDELGEYMDVVNVKGFLFEDENGNQVLHTGSKLARNFVSGGGDLGQSSNPKPLGDELVRSVKERLGIADTTTAQDLIRNAYYYKQLSYVDDNNFSNYIGWYGDEDGNYVSFWHDGHTQAEEQAAINNGAKFIYKSYGYLGEVNAELGIEASDMMHTAIRVRKTIADGVEGTSVGEIVVEGLIPASLIPKITYEITLQGKDYESGVQSVAIKNTSAKFPGRILYEVALRPDINPNNIAEKVNDAHKNQDGTYTFYTNAWKPVDYENNVIADTSENTFTYFEPSIENERYYYLTDSVVYSDDRGTVYTGAAKPEGNGYYHEYRVFTVENGVPGSKITYIKTSSEALEHAVQAGNQWVIPAGTGKHEIVGYKVFLKNTNNTGTNEFTAYPKIKTDADNFYEIHTAHYAVVTLGNNGRLRVNVEPIKKVYDEDISVNPNAENIDGSAVMVGDVLTYTIKVTNYEDVDADITVTDNIPEGTVYVGGSADNNGVYDSTAGKLTWTLAGVDAGSSVVLSFKVQVTEAALSNTVNSISNTANITVDIGENSYSFDSNTTTNQTEGKTVVDSEGQSAGTVKLGDVLVYSIQFVNDQDTTAKVTITDVVPAGLAFVSADHNGRYNANTKTVTWTFTDVQPGHSGVVTFRAVVTADAASLNNVSGTDTIVNHATITVGENNPQVRITNETTNDLMYGDLVLTKAVTGTNHTDGDVFRLILTDSGATTENIAALTGKYACTVYEYDTTQNTWNTVNTSVPVLADFDEDSTAGKMAGVAYVTIEEDQYVVVEDLPTGLILNISEDTANMPAGYTLESIQNSNVTVGTTQVTSGNISEVITNPNYVKTVVNNTYSTVPASVTLVTTKALANKAQVEGEFSFVLKEGTDDTGATKQMVSNDAAGNVKFAALTFNAAGTYTYNVTEVKGSDDNIAYSNTRYILTINVSDNNNGALVAVVGGAVETSEPGVYRLGTATVGGFDNTYTPDPVSMRLSGTKTLTGAAADGLSLDEYSFVLKEGTTTIATAGNAADSDADANGNYEAGFAFPTMYYHLSDLGGAASKTFTYTVSEVIPATNSIYYDPNMKYDTTVYTVNVTLSYDSSTGLLSLSQPVVVGGGALSFTNIQNPDSVSVPLRAGKATANVSSGDASRFSFVITDVTDTGNPKEVIYGTAPAVSAGDAEVAGNVTFPELTYTADDLGSAASKTFEYTMKEVGAGNDSNGIKHDPTVYSFSVTLSRDANGALQAVRSYNDAEAPVFHNVYEAKGSLTISTKKSLDVPQGSARTLQAGEFRFKLERYINDVATGVVHYGTNDANGNVVFDTLYYTQADAGKTYTYIMTEQPGNVPGVAYDTTKYKIAVTIEDNGDGTVKAEIFSVKKVVGSQETAINTIHECVFVNRYSVTQGTNEIIKAKKVLSGRTLEADEFKFNLYYIGNGTVTENRLISSVTNDADGNVSFALSYPSSSPVGSYIYRIEEEAPVLAVGAETNGIEYSNAVYYAKVTITDNGSQLSSSVSYYSDAACTTATQLNPEAVEFINEYTTEKLIWTPVNLYKQLTGRNMAAGEFTFELEDITDNNSTLKLTGTNEAARNGQYGAIVFDAITYTDWNNDVAEDTKTFKYRISEVVDAGRLPAGVEAQRSVLYMTVTVKDTGMGTLAIEAVNYFFDEACNSPLNETAALINTYVAKPTNTVLSGRKYLDNKKLVSGEFEFKLEGHGLTLTTANDANGLFSFPIPESVLKEAGIYEFTVSESNVNTAVANNYTGEYSYDTAYVKAYVKVADDGKGQLYVANIDYREHFEGNDVPVSGISFLNSYEPAPITKDIDASFGNDGLNVDVDKSVDTSTSGIRYDLDGFKFEVRDLNDALVSTGISNEFGDVNFDEALTFKEVGQYRFWISEVDTNSDADATNDKANVTFSDEVWELHVLVHYDEVNGVLYIGNNDVAAYRFQTVGSSTNASPTLDIDYVNVYEPEPVTVDLNMTKTLQSAQGTSRVLQKHEFIFQIVDANNNLVAETANVGSDGSGVNFALTFDKVGIYNYKLKEVVGTKGGVTYDDSVYDIQVIVSDATLDGKLEADVTIKDQNQDVVRDIVFKNSYAATPAKVVITAQKTLENRPLAADEFTFKLVGETGDVYTAKNDAAGKVTFEELSFNAVGTYKFTLTENRGTLEKVTYSEETYNVTIKVKDDLQGKMIAEVNYASVDGDGNESIVSEPTFTNIFTPDPSTVVIDATKQLTGRDLIAGEFQFVVKDETGKELATGTNTADGKIYFKEFKLPEGNDHKLYVSEVDTAAEYILYDGATYMVLVDVTNDGSGILKATVEYPNGGIVFKNEYKEPHVIIPDPQPEPQPDTLMTSFAFNATKVLTGRIMAAGEFQFQVKDSNGEVVATGINEANGSIQFSPLVVFTPGRYVYTVSEVKGGALDITYDTKVYKVTVDVEQVGDDLAATINYPKGGLTFRNYFGDTTPRTGDATPIGLLIALVLISGAGVAGLLIFKRKKK